jgi:hypothetical protein
MILAALAAAAAQPAETPRAFIARVYSEYRHEGFSPLAEPQKFFSPALTIAIRKDSAGGEVGYLDGDPLCDCQDYDRISAQIRSMTQRNAKAADANVHVVLGPTETRDLRLSLVLTESGWRIADVVGADHRSLLRELRRANAKR